MTLGIILLVIVILEWLQCCNLNYAKIRILDDMFLMELLMGNGHPCVCINSTRDLCIYNNHNNNHTPSIA